MSRKWNEDAFEHTAKKCVVVNINGEFGNGKKMYLEDDWSLPEFLNAASQRLGISTTAERIFSADGETINDCMMLEDNEILFLSMGEEFIPPFDDSGGIPSNKDQTDIMPSVVGGYKVGQFLGKGGFGEVRLGEHQVTGERVALKFLRKADIATIGAAERTTTEIQCLTTLKHPNIICLQQYIESSAHFVLVFELMEGGDLYSYLVKRGKATKNYKLREEEVRDLFQQILSAISYAHNHHICHRDLKLENILLKEKELTHVKIADFGLSDFYRPGTMMKSSCGTLSFLAPEVFKGTSNAGPPLDVWSLGVILFAVLCGRMPFEGPASQNPSRPRDAVIRAKIMKCQYKLDDSLGAEVKDLIRRMLMLDPNERATIPEVLSHVWLRNPPQIGSMSPRATIENKGEKSIGNDYDDASSQTNAGPPNTSREPESDVHEDFGSVSIADSKSCGGENKSSEFTDSFKLMPLRRAASKQNLEDLVTPTLSSTAAQAKLDRRDSNTEWDPPRTDLPSSQGSGISSGPETYSHTRRSSSIDRSSSNAGSRPLVIGSPKQRSKSVSSASGLSLLPESVDSKDL